jgi:hypothetical protein
MVVACLATSWLHDREIVSLKNICVLLRVVVYHWILVVYYYGLTKSCSTRWNSSSCVLLANFHGYYLLTLGVAMCYLIAKTMTYDSSYWWNFFICVLPCDCRVVIGLLDEDIVKDTSMAKKKCWCFGSCRRYFPSYITFLIREEDYGRKRTIQHMWKYPIREFNPEE